MRSVILVRACSAQDYKFIYSADISSCDARSILILSVALSDIEVILNRLGALPILITQVIKMRW